MRWLRNRMGLSEIPSDELDWEKVEVHKGHPVKMLWRETLTTYNLQVLAPATDYEDVRRHTDTDKRILADLPAMLENVEEQLEALLPDGYQVRITEWDK